MATPATPDGFARVISSKSFLEHVLCVALPFARLRGLTLWFVDVRVIQFFDGIEGAHWVASHHPYIALNV